MTILDFAGTTPAVRPGMSVIQLHDSLWRVTRPSGEVLGYIERAIEPTVERAHERAVERAGERTVGVVVDRTADRYRAKRLLQRQRGFLPVGEFWSLDDAIDCFRF